jgi:predicted O-linked N-acetylglucosamine transferase (SPINDLY family)
MSHILHHLSEGHHLLAANRPAEAEAIFRAIIARQPDQPAAQHSLGVALIHQQRHHEAIAAFEHSMALHPTAEACLNLIQLLLFSGRKGESVALAKNAARQFPDDMRIIAELARALERTGDGDAALDVSREALARFGYLPLLAMQAGNLLFMRGKPAEACDTYQNCLAAHPGDHRIHSALLYTMHFLPGMTAPELAAAHNHWNLLHAAKLTASAPPHRNSPLPDRPLRIGYASPDFRSHGIGRFIAPLLEHHTKNQFETYAYSDVHAPDALTQRIRAAVSVYRNTFTLNDAQFAAQVRQDEIDILIDLTMHMPSNRLLAFAQKPAPVQICYLAYCSTTGMKAMDCRITDPFLDPAPAAMEYAEQSLTLPSYWCYEAAREADGIPWLPRDPESPVVFGCLNNVAKASRPALEAWAQILQQTPESKLLLHAPEGATRAELTAFFQSFGIAPERITFAGRLALSDYLRLHSHCDIALDPFPYNGGTTSCDALYMGVPVITLAPPADAPAISRAGISLLSQLGLEKFIARDVDLYVQLAVSLARNRPLLASLRQSLRPTMQKSRLMNPAQFNASLEAACRQTWQQWCKQPG